MDVDSEPIRLRGWQSLAAGIALMAALAWSQGVPLRPAVGMIALAVASQVGGIEWARRRAWSPKSLRRETRRAATVTGTREPPPDVR